MNKDLLRPAGFVLAGLLAVGVVHDAYLYHLHRTLSREVIGKEPKFSGSPEREAKEIAEELIHYTDMDWRIKEYIKKSNRSAAPGLFPVWEDKARLEFTGIAHWYIHHTIVLRSGLIQKGLKIDLKRSREQIAKSISKRKDRFADYRERCAEYKDLINSTWIFSFPDKSNCDTIDWTQEDALVKALFDYADQLMKEIEEQVAAHQAKIAHRQAKKKAK